MGQDWVTWRRLRVMWVTYIVGTMEPRVWRQRVGENTMYRAVLLVSVLSTNS